VQAFVQKDN